MHATVYVEHGDQLSQRILLGALGPHAVVKVNDLSLFCDDPDQLDALASIVKAAANNLRSAMQDAAAA